METACAADEPFAPWGAFQIFYASPEVVAAALGLPHILHAEHSAQHGHEIAEADDPSIMDGSSRGTAAPSADVWSLGLVLFEATAATPYWPPHFSPFEIVQALLGFTSLPHEANPHMLDACGELASVVGRMLAREPLRRPTLLEIGELAGNSVTDALVGFTAKEVRGTHAGEPLSCDVGCSAQQRHLVTSNACICALLCNPAVPVPCWYPGCRSNVVTGRVIAAASARSILRSRGELQLVSAGRHAIERPCALFQSAPRPGAVAAFSSCVLEWD